MKSQLARGAELPVDYVIAHHSLVNEKLVHDVQWARRKFVWTVNDRNRCCVSRVGSGRNHIRRDRIAGESLTCDLEKAVAVLKKTAARIR